MHGTFQATIKFHLRDFSEEFPYFLSHIFKGFAEGQFRAGDEEVILHNESWNPSKLYSYSDAVISYLHPPSPSHPPWNFDEHYVTR